MKKHLFRLNSIAAIAFIMMIWSCAVQAQNHTVVLTWTAPTSQTGVTITGYNLYRSTTSGVYSTPLKNLTGLTYTDSTVSNNTTYFYMVRATATCDPSIDCGLGESPNSNEITVNIPKQKVIINSPGGLAGVVN